MGVGIVGKGRTAFQTNTKVTPAILPYPHQQEEKKILVASCHDALGLGGRPLHRHTKKSVPLSAGMTTGPPELGPLSVSLVELRFCSHAYLPPRGHTCSPGISCPQFIPRVSKGLCVQRGPQMLGFLKTIPRLSTPPGNCYPLIENPQKLTIQYIDVIPLASDFRKGRSYGLKCIPSKIYTLIS